MSVGAEQVARVDLALDVGQLGDIRLAMMRSAVDLNSARSRITRDPKKRSSSSSGSKTMTSIPLPLIRFITPCTDEKRKLSDPDFIASRCTPTTRGLRAMMSIAMKSLRVVLASTMARMRFCGTFQYVEVAAGCPWQGYAANPNQRLLTA